MCVYTYICIHTYICMYTYIYAKVYTFIYTHTHKHISPPQKKIYPQNMQASHHKGELFNIWNYYKLEGISCKIAGSLSQEWDNFRDAKVAVLQ